MRDHINVCHVVRRENIKKMNCSACLPDLNAIEHVWDITYRRAKDLEAAPATVNDLHILLQEKWQHFREFIILVMVWTDGSKQKEELQVVNQVCCKRFS